MLNEKRRARRVFQENEVTIAIVSKRQKPPSDRLIYHISTDISASGARIQANRFLPVDSLLKLQLTLKDPSQRVTALGRVKWVRSLFADESYEAGLEFVDMAGETTEQLAAYVAHRAPDT